MCCSRPSRRRSTTRATPRKRPWSASGSTDLHRGRRRAMATVDTIVRNARLVTPTGIVQGGVAIRDGRIVAIGDDADLPPAHEAIDCGGKIVLPGLVDPHVHMGGQFPYEENCQTEGASAVAGGVTTILQYRLSRTSFLDDFDEIRAICAKHFFVDTAWHFILSNPKQIDEI